MQRSLVFAIVLLFAALAGAAWWFLRGDDAPPLHNGDPSGTTLAAANTAEGTPPAATDPTPTIPQREAVATATADDILDDPDVRAGLCGFKGRVVDHQKVPVPHTGVRIYRGAMDMIVPLDADLFVAESSYVPDYIAGETKTSADGTWQITGVWPNGFHLLFAGIGSDAPVHQIVTRTPSRGEIVDLGDIVLPHAGVVVGTVLDDNGDPLPGALVRAADLPGTLAALFPVERFDPDGAVLIREQGPPVRVVEMPGWVKSAFEKLPIPSTRTDGDGRFRLVGVVPGSNLLATTAPGFLSDLKPSVQVRAGQEKDVGKIRMKRGEELTGKVLDTAGKPVAEAEVFAGSTLSMAPVDLAQRLAKTDAEGRFSGQGFSAGKVTVAARRGKGHPWTLAEPQPILGEVVVTLPATFAIEATITLADGKPAKSARLQLLQGRAGDGAAEMFLLGLSPPIDLRDRSKQPAEGRWRIENLAPGTYTLVADAPGHATSFAIADVTTNDATVTLALTEPKTFTVRVVDPEQQPIRNVTIYAEARGQRSIEMPVRVGRTGGDGRLVIDKLHADELRVSADHPKWGVVHGEMKLGTELTLVMQLPGTLQGVITENGKPPEPGKFTVVVEPRGGNGPRGATEAVPPFLSPGLDGTFAMKALQPGSYQVHAIRALDSLRSPGGIFNLVQEMRMTHDLPRERITITSGQVTTVALEAGQKPIDGPTAQLTGSLSIDGKLGVGHAITYYATNRRFSARVDERGRFDLGIVPAGNGSIAVLPTTEGMMFGAGGSNLWSSPIKLESNELKELTIEVLTSSVRGLAVQADGSPVKGGYVQANGVPKGASRGGGMWMHAQVNADGEFRFDKMPAGTWSFEVNVQGGGARGKVEGIELVGGVPLDSLRIEVRGVPLVKGRVDLTVLGDKKADWAWISFHRLAATDAPDAQGNYDTGVGIDMRSGEFTTDDLDVGRYRLRLHASFGERERVEYAMDELHVPPGGLRDLQLRVGARITR